MSDRFAIHRQWVSASNESPEVAQTSAMLKIVLGDEVITRNEDEWSLTLREEVRLSAYPIALWFASSWWRLRWEPVPSSASASIGAWRMAHEMSAAGYGYVWPRLLFGSDGDSVNVWAFRTRPEQKVPVRYLSTTHHLISAKTFESTLDDFVTGVLARLDAVKVERTALRDLWSEITEERADPALNWFRRLEALLGFDPDDAPGELMERFRDLSERAGTSAVNEVATVCASANPAGALTDVLSFAESEGLQGEIDSSSLQLASKTQLAAESWRRGWELAGLLRNYLGLSSEPIDNKKLCDALGLPLREALDVEIARRPMMSLAVRSQDTKEVKFLVRKRNVPGRRFELARFLCDYLTADINDNWLPVTDARTARQKTQRAFAAEFLCPIEGLKDFLSGDFSPDAIDDAAAYFGVAPRAVETQLVNNDLLPREILADYNELPHYLFKSA